MKDDLNCFKKFGFRFIQYGLKYAMYLIPWKEPTLLNDYDEYIKVLKENNINKVLIVTIPFLIKNNNLDDLFSLLKSNLIEYVTFSDVASNPIFENVDEGVNLYHHESCNSILAIGGGSVIDCAKAIGLLITNKPPLEKYKGIFKVHHNLPLLSAVPTTCGTGSETTLAAVIRNDKTKEKFPIEAPRMVPSYALLNPRLLLGLPSSAYAYSSLDALTHAIESYLNITRTSKTKKYSLKAVELIKDNIEGGFNDPLNEEYKKNMLLASFLAGKAFTRSMVGNVHALAHALGGKYNLAHGMLNAMLLPLFLKTYLPKAKKRMNELAIAMKLNDSEDALKNANDLISYISSLDDKFNIPKTINELKEEDYLSLATQAYNEAKFLYSCPKIYSINDYIEILKQVKGK